VATGGERSTCPIFYSKRLGLGVLARLLEGNIMSSSDFMKSWTWHVNFVSPIFLWSLRRSETIARCAERRKCGGVGEKGNIGGTVFQGRRQERKQESTGKVGEGLGLVGISRLE
jgi:hypothetical protein